MMVQMQHLTTYRMIVALVDLLLHGLHNEVQKVEPVLLPADLLHVNVDGGHGLVAALETRVVVVIAARRPAAVLLHYGHQVVAELLAHERKPVHFRARLVVRHN